MRQATAEKPSTALARQKPRSVRATKALPRNTPRYQATIVEEDLVRRDKDGNPLKGGALLAMISGRAIELGHNRQEMAKHLDVTYGYIAQLTSGHRKCEHISMEFADNCTRYLGVPKMTVLMAAGVVSIEDTFENPEDLSTALPLAMQFVARDPIFGSLMPTKLLDENADPALQFFIIRLYEAATKRKFLPGEHTIESIVTTMKKIEGRRQELLEA